MANCNQLTSLCSRGLMQDSTTLDVVRKNLSLACK